MSAYANSSYQSDVQDRRDRIARMILAPIFRNQRADYYLDGSDATPDRVKQYVGEDEHGDLLVMRDGTWKYVTPWKLADLRILLNSRRDHAIVFLRTV